jgi:uncharacterized protein (TIGR02996 family)
MLENPDLLRAVLEYPENDAPRLDYADWFAEHGEPDRAEFIRAQVLASRLSPYDAAQRHLKRRAQALLTEHEKRWFGLQRGWVTLWSFERGWPDSATLDQGTLVGDRARDAGRSFFDWLPIRHVTCGLRSPDFAGLFASPALQRVRGLTLCNQPLTPATLEAMRTTTTLPCLEHLGLQGVGLTAEQLDVVLASPFVPQLTSLDLRGNPLRADVFPRLADCPQLARVTNLTLAGTRLGARGIEVLTKSPYLTRLTDLDLSLTRLGTGLRALARHGRWPLRRVNLSFSEVDSDDLAAFLASPGASHLESLDLTRCKLGDAGLHAVAEGPRLGPLVTLRYLANGATDAGLRALLSWPHLGELRELALVQNHLSADGYRRLAECPALSELRKLELGSNEGSELRGGVPLLLDSPYLTGLCELHVGPRSWELDPETLNCLRERFGAELYADNDIPF